MGRGYRRGEEDVDPGQLAGMEVPRRDISRRHALRSFLMSLSHLQHPWNRGRETTPGAQFGGPPVQRTQDSGKDAFQRRLKNLLGRKLFL